MNLRRAAPILFVALCLGLSALVLRRQIAAHPKPRVSEAQADAGRPVRSRTLHVAAGPARREVLNTILGQLNALHSDDAGKAMFYQSRGLRRNFRSPEQFVRMIAARHPEFGHCRSAQCGPVWTDATGRYAEVIVTVQGENGRRARGYYQLIREEGGYKVASVEGGQVIN